MIKFDFKNKTAIVTGGAQGFGLDITNKFLSFGAKVIIWDVDQKETENIVKKINNENEEFLNQKKFWCAASTHKGEETFCLKVHDILKKNYKLFAVFLTSSKNFSLFLSLTKGTAKYLL